MAPSIGPLGVVGVFLALAGIALIGYVDPLLAAGILGVLVGFALVIQDILRRVLGQLGLGGMI